MNIKNDMMVEKEKKFEGVDFNKEMGITEFTEEELAEKLKPLEIEPIPGQEVEENKTAIIENYQEESEEIILKDDEDEEDDDDVTFDDLLEATDNTSYLNLEKMKAKGLIEVESEYSFDDDGVNKTRVKFKVNTEEMEQELELVKGYLERAKEQALLRGVKSRKEER